MKLVVDTNIFLSALIKNSIVRKIIIEYDLELFTPDFTFEEINANLSSISKRTNLSVGELKEITQILSDYITIVDFTFYAHKISDAERIIGKIHKSDTPFIALALSFENDGIWTNDKHFLKQKVVKIWTTEELIRNL